jgi:uncharacterized repeat protein (TIGR01451 family)
MSASFVRALLILTVGALLPVPARAQQTPQIIPVPAGNMVWDSVSRKIYATVGPDGRGALTNSITTIDPATGQVGASVFVGSGPGALTLSDKSKYLYVAVSDGTSVRRVDLSTMTAGPQYPMTGKPVRALLPLPGVPEGFIALRGNHARYDDTLGVYVNGQVRGSEASCAPSLAVGLAPTRLFSYQGWVSSWDFNGYEVTERGISSFNHTQSLMSGFVGLSGSLNGLVVASNGCVIDPEVLQVVGRLNFGGKQGAFLPDPRTGTVLCIGEGKSGHEISVCSVRNFQYLGTVPVAFGVKGGVGSPIRWGEDGIAFTAGGSIVAFRFLPGPALPPVDLTVQRSSLPATLPPGGQLRYRLTVSNAGTQPASAVFLSDALPPATDVLSVTPSQGSATFAEGTVRAELGQLAPSARVTVDVTLRFREVRDVRFTAVVRGHEPDSRPDDNISRVASEGPLSPLADLTGSWTALRQVAVGAGVNLQAGVVGRFVVRNEGKGISRPVLLRFYLSFGPRFVTERSPLLQEVRIPALRPGQSYPAALEALLPPGDDVTGFHIFGVLDADRTMEEGNRSNNVVGQRVP